MSGFETKLNDAIKCCGDDSSVPIVLNISFVPFLRLCQSDPSVSLSKAVSFLSDLSVDRDIYIPTFSNGFRCGAFNVCESNNTISGVFAKASLEQQHVRRSLSAFFSFSTLSENAYIPEVKAGAVCDVWGLNSLLEYFEFRNAYFIQMGLDAIVNSFFHRAEWNIRKSIKYRFLKSFSGMFVGRDTKMRLTERLFCRRQDSPEQFFDPIRSTIERDHSFHDLSWGDIPISVYRGGFILKEVESRLLENSNFLIKS